MCKNLPRRVVKVESLCIVSLYGFGNYVKMHAGWDRKWENRCSDQLHIEVRSIQSGEGELRLSQKYALNKKCTFFTKSIRNFVKKKGTCECLILTKFCNGRVKIVDFLIKAYFWESLSSPSPLCIYIHWNKKNCKFLDKITKSRVLTIKS